MFVVVVVVVMVVGAGGEADDGDDDGGGDGARGSACCRVTGMGAPVGAPVLAITVAEGDEVGLSVDGAVL